MTPETEIDALARRLMEQYRTGSPRALAWDDCSEVIKNGYRAQARFVLTERRRAERAAFVAGAAYEYRGDPEGVVVRDMRRHETARQRYPLPESDASCVPEAVPPIEPLDDPVFEPKDHTALRQKINEIAAVVNRLAVSSPTQEKAS